MSVPPCGRGVSLGSVLIFAVGATSDPYLRAGFTSTTYTVPPVDYTVSPASQQVWEATQKRRRSETVVAPSAAAHSSRQTEIAFQEVSIGTRWNVSTVSIVEQSDRGRQYCPRAGGASRQLFLTHDEHRV